MNQPAPPVADISRLPTSKFATLPIPNHPSGTFTMRFLATCLTIITLLSASSLAAHAAILSEFSPDPPGRDGATQTIELSGVNGMSFNGFVLAISGSQDRFGVVESAEPISGTFDSNGILTSSVRDLFVPTSTYVLTEGFMGTAGTTMIGLDGSGNVTNLASLGTIRDAIGVADSVADESRLFGAALGGQDFAYTGDQPELVFRDASIGDWYALNSLGGGSVFNIDADDIAEDLNFSSDPFATSFGSINPGVSAIPEPSSIAALGMITTTFLTRRHRKRKQST